MNNDIIDRVRALSNRRNGQSIRKMMLESIRARVAEAGNPLPQTT